MKILTSEIIIPNFGRNILHQNERFQQYDLKLNYNQFWYGFYYTKALIKGLLDVFSDSP